MSEPSRSTHSVWTVPAVLLLLYLIGFAALRGGLRSLVRHGLRYLYDGSASGAGASAALEEWGLAVAPLVLFALAWLLTDLGPDPRQADERIEPPAPPFGSPPQPQDLGRTPRRELARKRAVNASMTKNKRRSASVPQPHHGF